MAKLNLITGATGLLGSHIAEQLRANDEQVRALVRPASDAHFLKELGVEVVPGDLMDAGSVRNAMDGVDIVYHCAARVSDWGAWKEFEEEAGTTTRNVVNACQDANVGRLLHVSSISVYGHPKLKPGELVTEDHPLGQNLWMWDYYPMAKLLAEEIVREYTGDLTVVRPSWIYGPRDRVTIPRVVPALQSRKVPIIGDGNNKLNIIYAGDVAEGAIAAANDPDSVAATYNLCSEGEVTQREMIDTLTDALDLPRITKHRPFWLVKRFAFMSELFGKMLKRKKPPRVTRRAVYLIARPTHFSIAKAREKLNWEPRTPISEGMKKTLAWYDDAHPKSEPHTQ